MFGSIGMPEMIIILVIALIIFGPRKLPELGRSLGRSINEFKKASNELRSTLEDEIRVEEKKEQRAQTEADQREHVRQRRVPARNAEFRLYRGQDDSHDIQAGTTDRADQQGNAKTRPGIG